MDTERLEIVDNELRMATVVNLSENSTLKLPAVLAEIDPNEDSEIRFQPGCEFQVYNPIRVLADGSLDDVIGHAVVHTNGKRLLADLFIRRDCPQRLDLEAKVRKFWCATGFEIIEAEVRDEVTFVTKCLVHTITLQERQIANLPALGEPIL